MTTSLWRSAREHLPAAAVIALLAVSAEAKAATISIDSTVSGCFGGDGQACSDGSAHLFPGSRVTLIDPVTITLAPGAYTITDAATSGYYSAWNFSGGWVWNWAATTDNGDGTGNVFLVGASGYIYGSQSAAAGAHDGNYGGPGGPVLPLLDPTGGPDNYSLSFTLPTTTKLDFFTIDYYLPDNAGGVALDISAAAPEPSTWAMLTIGFAGLGALTRRRRSGAGRPGGVSMDLL
jgi:hypothetical protein